ncbi:MAG TPA: DUF4390 domain-containing protein, partial [Methylophaga aminisulfidivorans]|nr:DUF4390 domain-containing protein [Methylophaga aminisulfidivorans]
MTLWTDFIMPVFSISKRLLQIITLWLLMQSTANAAIFSVNNPIVSRIGNGYVLSAQISYPLTPRVIEALQNGVPITFFQELKLIDAFPLIGNFWQWETTLWEQIIRYQLRYHALSEQYVLESLDTKHQQSFPSLTGALAALGKISKMPLPPKFTSSTEDLLLEIRSGLDLNALPTPMRPGALIS